MNKNTVILLSKAKQSHNCLLNNNFKFYISQFLKAFKFLSASILLHNLVKTFLTSIKFTFDSLSRKIKNPCLVINKNFLKENFTMKSKQIIIMLLSFIILFAISCKNNDKTGSIPASVGDATFIGTLNRTALNGPSEIGLPDTYRVGPNGDSELIIAGNKVSFMSLVEAQLFTSGDNKVVEASVEYSDAGMTAKEYIKITLDNASAPTKAQVEYQTGVSGNGLDYSATYTGNLTKQ